MSISPIDPTELPLPAQKILDPAGPLPLKTMGAKGVAPGLKPAEMLAVVVALSLLGGPTADTANATLAKLPAPLLNGALDSAQLHPAVLDALATRYANDGELVARIVQHPRVADDTIVSLAATGGDTVCELVATNEERLLANPAIIEKLYMNKGCRMSTSDRLLELAVRNGIELAIPAFAQAKAAIEGELIAEPTYEPTFDDTQFDDVKEKAKDFTLDEDEDTHALNPETGEEEVTPKTRPLHAVWADLRPSAKIRFLNLATLKEFDSKGREIGETRYDAKAIRMLGVRDANPLVAVAALNTPGIADAEIVRITTLRNVAEDVLRNIANSKSWTRHYMVKFNLVANPRTPFGHAAKFVMHLRETDLKTLTKSKDVSGAIGTAVRQQLARKGK